MSTYKVTLDAGEAQFAAIASLITEVIDPPPAVSIQENGAAKRLEVYFVERPDLNALRGLVADVSDDGIADALQLVEIPDENWVVRVQRGLHPVQAGRFLVHGSHDRQIGRGKRYAIEIDAGQAFGTAHHGTTRGCLIGIDRLGKRLNWRTALDLGTGSGILAIAVAKLSNARVLASDIDPIAVEVAVENFQHNGVSGKVRGVASPGVESGEIRADAPFDLITANILAGPLLALAPRLTKLVAPGGHIMLSGLLDSQAREVAATYMRLGLAIEARLALEGWATLILRRRG